MEDQQQQQRQQQECQQELAKLRAIEAKVKQVQDKLTTRLPHQHSHLAAMVCGTTWVNRVRLAKKKSTTSQQEQYEQIVKKVRMELGAFDYQVKEQGELLTRYLCELDNILSFGNGEVKDARKALVVFIQSLLTTADEFRTKSAKLKEFGKKLMATLPKPAGDVAPVAESKEDTAEDASEDQTPATPVSEAEDIEMKPLFAEEEEEDEEDDDEDDEGEGEDDSDEDAGADQEDDDEESDQEMDDDDNNNQEVEPEQSSPAKDQTSPRQSPRPQIQRLQHQQQKPHIDIRSLPVWRPYYQIQKRRDGLYLVANLRDVDPENVRVQWIEHAGVLHISGHKLPTQKDIMVSRFSGVPTFGRFEIAERLPASMLNMEHATQRVGEDGTLEIRMPYYLVQQQQQRQPRLFTRGSLFESPRCMVW